MEGTKGRGLAMSEWVLGVPIPELSILSPFPQHNQELNFMKERGLRLWGKLGTRKGREGVSRSWWMGWRARGLVGAEEKEGQSRCG